MEIALFTYTILKSEADCDEQLVTRSSMWIMYPKRDRMSNKSRKELISVTPIKWGSDTALNEEVQHSCNPITTLGNSVDLGKG